MSNKSNILDINKYRINKKDIKNQCDRLSQEEREERLGRIANMTYCHIIVTAYYLAELYGMTPTLQARIDRLSAFYHVTGVEGYNAKA